MRVLFTCAAADGHFLPLVPLARAFRDRGDEVAVATADSYGSRVEAAGLTALAAGIGREALDARYSPYATELLTMPIPDRRAFAYKHRFALLDSPARLADLRSRAATWNPDVLIHESAELSAPAVATSLGIPSVHHSFGRAVPLAVLEGAAAVASEMWESLGLAPEPFAGMFRGAYVDICPASLNSGSPPPGTTSLSMRALAGSLIRQSDRRPLIYVTLGTVVSGAAIFRMLLSALADVEADVLVTTGPQNDPRDLEPLPSNARAERYLPQAEVLPRCSLVVTHGGSGSMLGALAHGLPMLVVPRLADQFDNATSAAQAGAARVLMPDQLEEPAIREAVDALLNDQGYRRAARLVADEIAAMPSPGSVAETIAASLYRQ